jgi:putative membrane protein
MMRAIAAAILVAGIAVPAGQAWAHGGDAPSDAAWRIAVAVPLVVAGGLYVCGLRCAWRRAGPGRIVRRNEALAFGAGFLVLASMLVSPLHAWGRLRFTPHMLEHELLTLVAAPLLAAGGAGVAYLFALPRSWRHRLAGWIAGNRLQRLWRGLFHPAVAWALHGGALWLWHAPALFEAALENEAVHYLQHASLFGTALLFWASILPRRADRRTRMVGVFSLFATSMHATLLGALLTLSPKVWYATYTSTLGPAGLSALEDQQLAGLAMWVPGGLIYVGAALALVAGVLREDAASAPRRGASLSGA